MPIPTEEELGQKKQLDLTQGFAVDRDPDDAAESAKFSQEHGVRFTEAEKMRPKLVGKGTHGISWGGLVSSSPVLAQRLSDPVKAATSSDDVENLSAWETLLRMGRQTVGGMVRGNVTRQLSSIYWDDLLVKATPEQMREAERLKTLAEMYPEEKLGLLTGVPMAAAEMAPLSVQTLVKSTPYAAGGTAVGAGVGAAGGALAAGVGAIPGALAGAGTGAVVGWRAGSAIESGKAEAGLAWMEYKDLPNVDVESARSAALTVGVINGALESIGLESIFKVVPGLRKIAGKGARDVVKKAIFSKAGRAALAKIAKHVGAATFTEGFTEGLQELVTAVGGYSAEGRTFEAALDEAWKNRGKLGARVWDATVKGAQGGGGQALVVSVGGVRKNLKEAQTAIDRQGMWSEMGQLAKDSKLRERLPAEFREYIEANQKKYGAIESVSVPADKVEELFQHVDPDELVDVRKAVAEAKAANDPTREVVIRTTDLAAHLAPLDGFKNLIQDIRVGEEPTAREAPVIQERAKQLMKEQKEQEEKVAPSPVFDEIHQQLKDSGISDGTARKYAAMWASVVENRASRMKTDPQAYWRGLGVTVGNEELMDDAQGDNVLTPEQEALKVAALSGDRMAADSLIEQLAVDPLTGANDPKVWQRFKSRNMPGVYVTMDVNDLKRANEQFGEHTGGDTLLKALGAVLGKSVRDNRGKFFRSGGDEFTGHFRTQAEADAAMKAITESVNALPLLFEGKHKASISMGSGSSFPIADAAGKRAKEKARAAGRSGFGRAGVMMVPDLAQGDVFYEAGGGAVEELHQDVPLLGAGAPPAPRWHSAAINAVKNAKREKGDAKSWAGIVKSTPGVKKEELAIIGFDQQLEMLAAGKKSLTKDQVIAALQPLQIEEDWQGEFTRPPTAAEITAHEKKMEEYRKALEEYEANRGAGLDDDAREALVEDLSNNYYVSAQRRHNGDYNYYATISTMEESTDLGDILSYINNNIGISRADRAEIESAYSYMQSLYESPEDYYSFEHGFEYDYFADLDDSDVRLEEIDKRREEIRKELDASGDQYVLIPRTEEEDAALVDREQSINDEDEKLQYEAEMIKNEPWKEVDSDMIREQGDRIEELSDSNIQVTQDADGQAHIKAAISVESESSDVDEILNWLEETQGTREQEAAKEIMDQLNSDEVEPPPTEPAPLASEKRGQHPEYTNFMLKEGELSVEGTQRTVAIYAPGEGPQAEGSFSRGHFGSFGVGMLAHARIAEQKVGDRRVMMIEEIQSDRFQKARDFNTAWRNETKDMLNKLVEIENNLADPTGFDNEAEKQGQMGIWKSQAKSLKQTIEARKKYAKRGGLDSLKAVAARLEATINRQADKAEFTDPETGRKTTIRDLTSDVTKLKFTDEELRDTAAQEIYKEIIQNREAVQDAPFKDAWYELTIRRLVMYAVDLGYDEIMMTTGEQQVTRWSDAVQTNVRVVMWEAKKDEKGRVMFNLQALDSRGDQITAEAANENFEPSPPGVYNYDESRVRNIIGGTMTNQIREQVNEWQAGDTTQPLKGEIKGQNLKIGGEGFRFYYDTAYRNYLGKILKSEVKLVDHPGLPVVQERPVLVFKEQDWGEMDSIGQSLASKVSDKIDQLDSDDPKLDELRSYLFSARPHFLRGSVTGVTRGIREVLGIEGPHDFTAEDFKVFKYRTGIDLEDYAELPPPAKAPAFDQVLAVKIPEEVAAEIKEKGLPLFQQQGTNIRGSTRFDEGANWFQITLTGKANLSTFIHESGHVFLEILRRDARQGHAQSQADLAVIHEWLGAAPGGPLTAEQKERWARGIEAYTREGIAPSMKLREVFRAFRGWLMMIYASLKGLNVNLTPEVRGVMDRLFATDQEITDAKESLGLYPTENLEGLDQTLYAARFEESFRAAREEFDREALREWKRDIGAEAQQIRKEIGEEIKRDLAYNAQAVLKGEARLDGFDTPASVKGAKLNRAAVKELVPDAGRRLGPLSTEGGMHPDTVAPFLGYATGTELINALAELKSPARYTTEELHRRLSEKYPGFDGSKEWYAEGASRHLHSEQVGNVLWSEWIATVKNAKLSPGKNAKQILIAAVDQRVSEMTELELRPGTYERGEMRAAREWHQAMKKKDFSTALDAKRRQLWNHLMYKRVTQAREEVDSIRRKLLKYEEMPTRKRIGKAGPHFLAAIDAYLEGIELRPQSKKALDNRDRLAYAISVMEADGDTVMIPEALRTEASLKSYRKMSLTELRAVDEAVSNVATMARMINKVFDGRKERNFTEITTKLAQHIKANVGEELRPDRPGSKQNPGWWDQKRAWLRSAHFSLSKVEFVCRVLDGGQTAGFAHDLIFEPLAAAQKAKVAMTKRVVKALTKPFDDMKIADRLKLDREVDFLGHQLTLREVMAVVLNLGNDGNERRLIVGYSNRPGWSKENILKRAGELLDNQQLDIIEHTWAVIGSLKEDIGAVYQRNQGVQPQWVKPTKVTINGRELSGGYYPIVKDRLRSHMGEAIAQRKTSDVWENNFMHPVTESGFTQGRGNDMSPLLLSLDVVPAHLNEVIHYITHYEAVRAVDRLMANKKVEAAVKNGLGGEAFLIFRPWLQAIAKDGNIHESQDFIDKTLRRLRLGSSIAWLGFKVSTGLKQWFGLTGALKELGVKYTAVGGGIFAAKLGRGENPFAEAGEFSSEISEIDHSMDRDISDMFDRMTGAFSEFGHLKKQFAHAALGWIMLNQKAVNAMTWYGAREKALAEGHPDPERYANSVVRMTQAGSGIKDLAAIQRGTETKRLFTCMYTYFSVLYNQIAEGMPGKTGPQKMATFAARWFWLVTLPVIMETFTGGRQPEDGDDPEDWLKFFTTQQILYAGRSVPLAGSVAEAFLSDREARYGAWLDTLMKGAAAAGKAVRRGEEPKPYEVRAVVDLLGSYYGLPTGAGRNGYLYLDDYLSGRMKEPIPNLLFRSPSEWE